VSDKVYAYPCEMVSFILDSWFNERNLILPSFPQIAPTPHYPETPVIYPFRKYFEYFIGWILSIFIGWILSIFIGWILSIFGKKFVFFF